MLILSRKRGEVIRIGQDIYIEIKEISGNRIKVGISAPATVTVLRGEVLPDTISIEGFIEQQAMLTRRETAAEAIPA